MSKTHLFSTGTENLTFAKMERGRVIKSTGSRYAVETESGEILYCGIRGRIRTRGIRSTNPVAVGDWVKVEGDRDDPVIVDIEKRKNYIVRRSVKLSKESHIIAANLDLAIMVATMLHPTTLPVFIDRFCVAAEAYHIPVAVVFNKIDLLTEEERELLDDFLDVYRRVGYETLVCSATSGEGLDELSDLLRGKVSLFSGHSGVGKSTLLNKLDPKMNVRVGAISEAHLTGKHTTTFAEMHRLSIGGYVVDTPGIRGFGLVHFETEEIAGYFPEMRALLPDCKFHNCQHIQEPGCAVKSAVETGEVAGTRYNSYLNMVEDTETEESYR